METSQPIEMKKPSKAPLIAAIFISLLAGGLLGYAASYYLNYSPLSATVSDLQNQIAGLPNQNITYYLDGNVSLSVLYNQVKESVVVIRGTIIQYDVFNRPYYSQVQGSGFVYNLTGQAVVVTNNHVVHGAENITVTFVDGNAYAATVLGTDPYEDLAVVSVSAPQNEFKPVEIRSSTSLKVGDPVIAVGTPYGLTGSMTVGIVSALGRTMTEDVTGGYPIASVIQTSTAINPGNSGGPLLNYAGEVVGITTAIVTNSQGLGFAIPSSAILREISSLVATGSYNQHSSLNATGTDMTYEIAKTMDTNVTFGWLVVTASNQSGLKGGTTNVIIMGQQYTVGGDIIIEINQTRITNLDDLSSYLEENTLPGQTVEVTVVRNNATTTIPVVLGTRPAITA